MAARGSLVGRLIDWSAATAIRAWHSTVRIHIDAQDRSVDPRLGARGNIYYFWHEDLIFLGNLIAHTGTHVLISRSRDGQRIARVMEQLGFRPIRGSTSRGGASAAREVLRLPGEVNLGITVDGPRGPRRQMQFGAVFLASRTGRPLVAIGVGYDRPWRAGSWDRMAFARPFSRAVVSASAALHVPPDLGEEALAQHCLEFESLLHQTSARADRLVQSWVASGIRPSADGEAIADQGEERRAA